ncbi:hypothetical protein CAPTEDRAFT_203418 [Capitella teleta]|uniref:Homologous-pairing protein 2 homolog n=1 Tax=Capitella teleta TaxID=283909 RepID=R7VAA4_CAPTE|nr:hypothetical protein CAPTEDRAFT_203418 [Capitella teleta]|eukprot:ELU15467.1 hypothetical protein CAPTEDRAFT_203418 [Capitella teleta]
MAMMMILPSCHCMSNETKFPNEQGYVSSCEQSIASYLTKQNRPYSAIDIYNNLHKAFGKTLVVKSLECLASSGKIRSKSYGKQTVFVADQAQFPEVDEDELKCMESKITDLSSKIQSTNEQCRSMESQLRGLNSALTTEQAKERLAEATQECESVGCRLNNIKSNNNSVAPEERMEDCKIHKQKIMENRAKYVKEWRKRKRLGNDILNAILEGYPKSKKELFEDIGIETDEDYNVKPPDI